MPAITAGLSCTCSFAFAAAIRSIRDLFPAALSRFVVRSPSTHFSTPSNASSGFNFHSRRYPWSSAMLNSCSGTARENLSASSSVLDTYCILKWVPSLGLGTSERIWKRAAGKKHVNNARACCRLASLYSILRSIRPGLRSAGSKRSMWFV